MTNESNETLQSKWFLLCTVIAIAILLSVQAVTKDNEDVKAKLSSNSLAYVETWHSYNIRDFVFSSVVFGSRVKCTASPDSALRTKRYLNKRELFSLDNNSSVLQSGKFTYQEKKGHEVSSEIQGAKSHFEAAVGYKFNYAETKTYEMAINVPAYTYLVVYGYDVQNLQQYVTYERQQQVRAGLSWLDFGNSKCSKPVIREYSNYHYEYVER